MAWALPNRGGKPAAPLKGRQVERGRRKEGGKRAFNVRFTFTQRSGVMRRIDPWPC